VLKEAERDASPLLVATQGSKATLTELGEMRHREADAFTADRAALRGHRHQVQLVKTRLPEIAARQRERMLARLATEHQVDNERLEQVVIFAHKIRG
jgi:uncharacterized protein YicC (UPF0701 family)